MESYIYAVRASGRQERVAALIMEQKAKTNNLDVYAIAFNDKIPGYILVEVKDEDTLYKLINGVKHIKGVIKTPISLEEAKKMLYIKKEAKTKINIGDVVEIITGPFKGEKAKVTAVDEKKDLYTVVPMDVVISIPVNLTGKVIRLVKKSEE